MYHNLILNHIKKTSLGVFYKKKLKKYIFFRIILNFVFWRIIYLGLTNLFFLMIKNKYLVNLNLKFKFEIIKKLKNQNKFKIKLKTTNLSKPDLNNLFRINSKIQKYKVFDLRIKDQLILK